MAIEYNQTMMVNNKGNDYNNGVGIDNNEEDGKEWKLHDVLLLRSFCLINESNNQTVM